MVYISPSLAQAIDDVWIAVKNSPGLKDRTRAECLLGKDFKTLSTDTKMNQAFIAALKDAFHVNKIMQSNNQGAYGVAAKLSYASSLLAKKLTNMHNACGEHY